MTERVFPKAVMYLKNDIRRIIESVVTGNIGFDEDPTRQIITKGDPDKRDEYELGGYLVPHLSWLGGQSVVVSRDLDRGLPLFTRCEVVIVQMPQPTPIQEPITIFPN